MGDFPFGGVPAMQRQATTAATGFALQNGTPTILSWTAPDDGAIHRYMMVTTLYVSSTETGGQIFISYFGPNGIQGFQQVSAGGISTGYDDSVFYHPTVIKAGSTVSIGQGSALTGGAAILWAEIWGS